MPRVRRAPLTAVLAALAIAAPAAGAPPPLGGLTPFPGAAGCFNSGGTSGCATYAPQVNGLDLAQTASTVYASAGGSIMAYRRGADGGLTPLDCVASSMVAACSGTDADIFNVTKIAVSAATRTLYATAGNTAASSRILAYRLAPDGSIGARVGCLSEQSAGGCTDVAALDQPVDVTTSADGRKLYTASKGPNGGIAAFTVAADGTFPIAPQLAGCLGAQGGTGCATGDRDLTLATAVAVSGTRLYAAWHGGAQNNSGVEAVGLGADGSPGARLSCIAENSVAEPACATEWPGLTYPQSLLVAPDGGSLAVGGGVGAVSTFALGATGAIGARSSCEAAGATTGCTTRPGLGPVQDLAVSPDGLTLYAAAYGAGAWAFARTPGTGATGGVATCVAALMGCTTFAGVGNAFGVLVAPDGARAFVNSQATGGLAVFQREVGPACLPTSAAVAPPAASASLTLSCGDPNGDPITYELASPPAHGVASVTPAGLATYTPAAGFTGTDTFGFRATDGTVASATANVVVGVVPPAAAAPPPSTPAAVPLASTVDRVRSPVRARELVRFTGRASGDGLVRVEISVVRLDHGARAAARRRGRAACRRLRASGLLALPVRTSRPCRAAGFLTASGTARWTFNLLRNLPKGRYVIVSRAVGRNGTERSAGAARRNRRAFTVR